MEPTSQLRPWYKKKRYLIPLGLIGITTIALGGQTNSPANVQGTQTVVPIVQPASATPTTQEIPVQESATPNPTQEPALSNDNYYINVSGNQIHSPAYSNSIPNGATARCGDGTYSFSQHRQGTCSHHGGISESL